MSQAIVDPHELRRFAQNLKRFTGDLEANLSALQRQLESLSGTWRDQEQEKFASEFKETTRAVARFVAAANEHVPFLLRKAQRAEEYLQQR